MYESKLLLLLMTYAMYIFIIKLTFLAVRALRHLGRHFELLELLNSSGNSQIWNLYEIRNRKPYKYFVNTSN